MSSPVVAASPWSERWQRFASSCVRGFHAYAGWLVSISWKRFFLLSLLLMVAAGILHDLPPFRWTSTETVIDLPPSPPRAPREPKVKLEKRKPGSGDGVDISIDDRGIRITPRPGAASAAAPAAAASVASAPASAAEGAAAVDIRLPPGVASEAVKRAVDEARQAIQEAVDEARQEADEAVRATVDEAGPGGVRRRTRVVRYGDALPQLALLWILASAIIALESCPCGTMRFAV